MIRSAAILLSIAISLSATTINVPADQATIQAGIDAAVDGDTVLVQPGTYVENINFSGKNIVVGSLYLTTQDTSYISQTVIDGNQSGSVVTFESGENSSSKLSGFTIQNGYGTGFGGGGVYCLNSSPIMSSLIVSNNSSQYSAPGFYLKNSSAEISKVKVHSNFTVGEGRGGGIYGTAFTGIISNSEIFNNSVNSSGGGIQLNSASNALILNVMIKGNAANNGSGGGIALQESNPTMKNVLVIDNIATPYGGGGIYLSTSNPILLNCTIGGNSANNNEGGAIYSAYNSNASLINSILWGNGLQEIYLMNNSAHGHPAMTVDISHSVIQGGEENIQINDVNSVEWGGGNLALNPQYINSSIGLYNISNFSPCIGTGLDTSITPTTDINIDPRPNPNGSNPDMGAYENPLATPQHIPIIINIPDDYSTIQAGLNVADSTDTVLVQPGTYYENIIWPETNGIKLISAGDSSNTIIDGGGISNVIYMNPQTATIDTTTLIHGFRITNGSSINGGGLYLKGSPKIANNHIMNNICESYGTYGGGAYIEPNSSVAIIENSHFSSNSGWRGGAIYKEGGSLVIRNVQILENLADGRGGGLGADGGSLLVDGSVISGNIGSDGSGIHSRFNSLVCNNTLIEGNSGSSGGGITVMSGSIDASYITIKSNTSTNRGGGIYLSDGVQADINNAQIYDNTARLGGGLYDGLGNVNISNSKIISNVATEDGGGLYMEGSTVTFDSTSILHNYANNGGAAYLDILDGNFTNNTIWGNTSQNTHGIYLSSHGTLNSLVISNSNINNTGYSVRNENAQWVTANSNYWGHSSGPYHTSQNPNGQGDSVNVIVDISPWLSSPANSAPPISINSLIIVGTGNDFINLEWDPSPLGDFAGFKLYYDTDESGYPYENSIDIGSNTSHALSGLNIGTEYFLAVTVYDTDGNESWYSNEVTGVTRVMEVQNLDIAGDEDLYHLISHDPLITFDYFDSIGETQTNYQIQISTDSTFQSNMTWDSGVVASDATSVQYTEGALLDGVKYYLRAKVASGTFWSEWEDIAFGMNTEPSMPVQISLLGDEVTTSDVLLEISNSSDAEEDTLTYDFRLYDDTQGIQLDSAIAVVQDPDGTEWEVTTVLVDNSQHWWTVQAFDGYEYSELAGPESFLVNFENDDPAAFDLTSPLLDESIINQSPLFTWNPAVDPDPLDTVRYALYLDTPDPGGETFYPGIDTSFQLDYNLEDNTTYHWKVVAHDLNDSETESNGGYQSFTVNTSNDLPEYFELLYPVWDEMVVSLQPEFLWEASSDPDDETIVMRSKGRGRLVDQPGSGNTVDVITGYDFYLSTDSMMTDVVPVEVLGTSYSPTEDLLENQTYYWAVSAVDDSGGVTFSDTASFWTNAENEAPAEFALLLPTDAEVLTVLSPTFVWDPSSDPDLYDGFGYHILLGSSPEDMDTLWSGDDTTLTLDWELEDNMTYYWSVFAEDWNGLTTFNVGGYQSFTVNTSNDLPEYFELLYPVWDEMVVNLQPEFLWEASSDPDDETIAMRGRGKGPLADQSGSGNTVNMITGYDFYLSTDSMMTDVVPVEVVGTYYSPTEDLIENQTYYWSVSAIDDSGGVTFSDTASFWTNAENEAPEEFGLLLPAPDEVLTVLSPTFTWEPSSDPDLYDGFGYHIILGNSPEDMDTLWSGEDTTLTLEWELEDNTTYYWAVFAEDWSNVETYNVGGFQSFIINQGNDSPSMVDLITPDSVMVLTLTPEMIWTPAMDADPGDMVSYEMHWWGEGIEYDSVLTDTNATFVTSELEDNTQYFWEVIAMDQSDGISHSEAATFWTDLIPEAPGGFALLSPEDDVAGLSDMPAFEWELAEDPDPMDYATYTFQVATDSNFVDVVFETNTEVDVAHELTEALPVDAEYWWKVIATDTDSLTTESETFKFTVGYVAIAEIIALPTEFMLDQNYPNPFNPSTTIKYGLPEDSNVSLVIYDIRGNTVRTIDSGSQTAGWYEHVWNGMNDEGQPVSTGLYLTRLRAGSYTKTIKMLYLK